MLRAVTRLAGLLAVVAAGGTCFAEATGGLPLEAAAPLYVKGTTLQETMLATRQAYAEAMPRQAEARAAVKLGPWHLANLPPGDAVASQPRIDLGAKTPDGRPAWVARAEWTDGKPFDWPGTTAWLCRTITAARPVRLVVGAGAGDRLDLYLNGRRVLSADTAIPYGRYGTSMQLDGSRVDQVVCTLPLAAGENWLVMRVHQQSPGPRQACFSAAPGPVPFFWRQLEKDFPRKANRLLEVVRFDWFEAGGWFALSDARLERQMLDGVLEGLGPRGATLRARFVALQKDDVPAADRRWLDLCVTAAELFSAATEIDRLRAAVGSLAETYPGVYPGGEYLGRLDGLQRQLIEKAAGRLDPADEASRQLRARLEAERRQMLVASNPLLKGQKLLFVRRYTYDSQHFYDDYYHGVRKYGGGLCRLSIDDGKVEEALPRLAGGVVDRFDVSPDARRVVLGYRPPRPEGFRIWEGALDGSSLRQLTFEPEDEAERMARYSLHPPTALQSNSILHGHWTDDMHPCYLPSGEIVFASSRCERTAVCGGHTLPCTVLYKIQPDGSRMQRLSQGMLSEFTPTVLEDGRILYNRWEYVFKGIAAIQPLWVMRPDGSGSEEIYGDNIRDPGVFYQARQVPGHPHLIVCNGCGHEPLSVGAVLLLDLHKDKRTEAVMRSLTPDTKVKDLRGLCQRRNGRWQDNDVYGPFYCDPYPISDKFFLVSYNPDKRHNDESAYGICLLDVFGNVVPIHEDPEMSCFVPTLLAPRKTPPVLSPVARPAAVAENLKRSPSNQPAEGEATVVLADVYRGLSGVERGKVKYLRIQEQIPRPWSVWPHAGDDSCPGQMVAVSWHSHIWISVLVGVVPVEEDGSAHFTVPADRDLYFQALDEDYMEVQRMRTFVNFRPGEQRACIGCHERRTQPPGAQQDHVPLAMRHGPVRPVAQPGDVAPRPVHYEADVQPILDRHCVSCHGNVDPAGDLPLTGERTTHFNRSYEQLMSKELVKVVTEWSSPPGRGSSWYWSMEHAPPIAPYALGSHASRLVKVLREGHGDVDLSRPEMVKLVTWVDTNGQYYGSYFGYRNVRYCDRKDFRPYPTLASARGVRPDLERYASQQPQPARLVAHWQFDEKEGQAVQDSSGGGHHATVVGARRVEGRQGGALEFSGNADFVRAGDLEGTFDTLSVALWVRADSLRNTWNALLFCDTWSQQDLHLSLLESGAVNVAIHDGSTAGYHRASYAAVGDGRWHHVAVVCDHRLGGFIQFYVDGKPDRKHPQFGPEMPVVLAGVRLGGYNVWERNPGANFHGAIDDFRVYRGMLSAEQVAELAGQGKPCLDEKPGK